MLNLLFIGDIVGFSGFDFVCENIQSLVKKHNANFLIINGENICNGKGITEREADKLFELGANVITTGNHIWENWISKPLMKSNNLVLRPYNYPPGNIGRGYAVVTHPLGFDIAVLQLQGRVFMPPIDCPFRAADNVLKKLDSNLKVIIVDFHAEATGEKVSMGHYLDGKVSAVIGTHTHIQTADAQILSSGTAYITDVGMSGSYDSVLGLRKDVALNRHIYQVAHRYEPATEDNKICGVSVRIDEQTGKAIRIENLVYPPFTNSIGDDENKD
ncbi:MAG: TIGR00282 family metallophosphoesterase [Ignavibacteria bacterium]|jgi:metallophosphoesterase (TIGR00282 family)|nr:TIGR00282 family metallophosphoesterase [Ignavibacteria bacterium]